MDPVTQQPARSERRPKSRSARARSFGKLQALAAQRTALAVATICCSLGCGDAPADKNEVGNGSMATFVSSGMKDAGYLYVNLDDCWMDGRDSGGKIQVNSSKFPSGMAALADSGPRSSRETIGWRWRSSTVAPVPRRSRRSGARSAFRRAQRAFTISGVTRTWAPSKTRTPLHRYRATAS